MSLNSPGVLFGMTPSGDTLNGDKGGISNGPERRPAKSSFSILRSTTFGQKDKISVDETLCIYNTNVCTNPPWEGRRLRLPQNPEVFIVELPIVPAGCQFLNHLPVLHEGRGLSGVLLTINAHENMKAVKPCIYS